MANPSLQIGNDNWAIKEDNLLGYSTAGTRFVPQPITMTRASAGTRVNSSGLVETVELLGSELVDCGNFECASPESVWGTGTGWSIANGLASYDGSGGTQSINQAGVVESSKTYKLTLDVVSNEGSGINTIYLGGVIVSNIHLEVGNYIFFVTTSSTASFAVFGRSGENFVIDNISVKESTKNNLARVDYDGTASSLLVEPLRTNLTPYSEDLSQWTLVNGTLTPNATVSPDGTQNAGKVAFNNTGVDLKKTITVVAGQTYTISFYIKLESGTGLDGRFYDNNNSANIEVYDYTSQIQGTEWSKITRSVTAPIGCTQMQIWLLASSSSLVTASFWGAQFEQGSYATSYIPTDGGTVTRVQETYEKTGISDLINSEEGVLFVEMAALSDDVTERYISLSDGSLNNRVYIQFTTTTNQIKMGVTKGGSTQASRPETVSDVTEFNKLAISYSQDLFKFYVNGSLVFTDSSGDTFTANTLNRLNFDVGTSGFSKFFGKVRKLQVYKTTDIDLAALTS